VLTSVLQLKSSNSSDVGEIFIHSNFLCVSLSFQFWVKICKTMILMKNDKFQIEIVTQSSKK